jgi:hypothetical protein
MPTEVLGRTFGSDSLRMPPNDSHEVVVGKARQVCRVSLPEWCRTLMFFSQVSLGGGPLLWIGCRDPDLQYMSRGL